ALGGLGQLLLRRSPGLDGLGQPHLVVLGEQGVLPDISQVEPYEVLVIALNSFLGQELPNLPSPGPRQDGPGRAARRKIAACAWLGGARTALTVYWARQEAHSPGRTPETPPNIRSISLVTSPLPPGPSPLAASRCHRDRPTSASADPARRASSRTIRTGPSRTGAAVPRCAWYVATTLGSIDCTNPPTRPGSPGSPANRSMAGPNGPGGAATSSSRSIPARTGRRSRQASASTPCRRDSAARYTVTSGSPGSSAQAPVSVKRRCSAQQ